MTDLAKTIIPKSDQLNADDLIAGPRTITITDVRGVDGDQPIAVFFEGDNGKPYKPCKSMRRVMVHAWGADGNDFAGKRMTLRCDPDVQFGGIKVGGIRISHMSHIDREMVIPLTVTRAKRSPYSVKPLRAEVRQAQPPASRQGAPRREEPPRDDDFPGDRDPGGFGQPATDDPTDDIAAWAQRTKDELEEGAFATVAAMDAFTTDPATIEKFLTLEAAHPTVARSLDATFRAKRKALASVGR
jgi:hypothetical protein